MKFWLEQGGEITWVLWKTEISSGAARADPLHIALVERIEELESENELLRDVGTVTMIPPPIKDKERMVEEEK